MKKFISILLVLWLILQLCACQGAGSSSNGKIPTVLVDGDYYNTSEFNPVLNYAQYLDPGYNVNFEVLSSDPAERREQIARIRSEIEAGGGPDVFLLPTVDPENYYSDDETTDPLFLNVEKAMHSNLFLPLDSYIEQSVYLDTHNYYADVIDAGKTVEGQMTLPILNTYRVFWWSKKNMQDPNIEFKNWEAILACEDDQIQLSLYQSMDVAFGAQYGDLIDYENNELLITPEMLANDLQKLSSLPAVVEKIEQKELTNTFTWNEKLFSQWNAGKNSRRTVMLPNDKDGATTFVTAYAAINRNSKCPDEAFRFIELHMSREVQTGEGIYDGETEKYYGRSMSLNTKHFGMKNGGVPTFKNAWTDFGLISDMNQKITSVRFYSDMDLVLLDAWNEAQTISYDSNAAYEDYLQIAKDACDKMKSLLSE